MGKVLITNSYGDGIYDVEIIFDDTYAKEKIEANITQVKALQEETLPALAKMITDANTSVSDAKSALDSAIAAYAADPENESLKNAVDTKMGVLAGARAGLEAIESTRNEILTQISALVLEEKNLQNIIDTKVTATAYSLEGSPDFTGTVGSIEVERELKEGVFSSTPELVYIKSNFPASNVVWNPSNDGIMQRTALESPEQTFINLAFLPAVQKERPMFRTGVLSSIPVNNVANVILDSAKSSQHDLNINEAITLSEVPIDFPSCAPNSEILFNKGDKVLIQFVNMSWGSPSIIGFADKPYPCVLVDISTVAASYVPSPSYIAEGSSRQISCVGGYLGTGTTFGSTVYPVTLQTVDIAAISGTHDTTSNVFGDDNLIKITSTFNDYVNFSHYRDRTDSGYYQPVCWPVFNGDVWYEVCGDVWFGGTITEINHTEWRGNMIANYPVLGSIVALETERYFRTVTGLLNNRWSGTTIVYYGVNTSLPYQREWTETFISRNIRCATKGFKYFRLETRTWNKVEGPPESGLSYSPTVKSVVTITTVTDTYRNKVLVGTSTDVQVTITEQSHISYDPYDWLQYVYGLPQVSISWPNEYCTDISYAGNTTVEIPNRSAIGANIKYSPCAAL